MNGWDGIGWINSVDVFPHFTLFCKVVDIFLQFPCFLITLTTSKGNVSQWQCLPMFENTNFKCFSCPLSLHYSPHGKWFPWTISNDFVKQLSLHYLCSFEIVRKLFPILFLPLLFASSQLFARPKFILNWGFCYCCWYQKLIQLKSDQIQTNRLFW